ncbi:WXG100 family type VII secretion target [Plantactinospora sp. BB1]|uniref:CdiA C-terminal domain-containing protein n=1 Tax=Plantactinospora sp. BB1 TaxID=2071627 RepID=UPI000D16E621|nr:WXG100 family type VII secretion target [Plantactinospora sp. BB1]AVT36544.1 hypothetical protein C6W10_08715 [Plantactinospora sp. BB1]
MSVNPLVATPQETSPSPWSGIWIAEDIELLIQGIESGSWIDGVLGGVSAGLDALALVSDPAGVLLQYGIAWLIEHVKPLSEALDWLAGDPAQIAAYAQTWRNVAGSLRESVADLAQQVRADVSDWTGSAGDAYRSWAKEQQDAIAGLAKAADAMAVATESAGQLIAGVRMLVRDAIAALVSRLVVYAAELLATGGFAAPLVVEQALTLIASWAAKIARWVRALLSSLRKFASFIGRLDELIPALKKILERLRGRLGKGGKGTTNPSRKPDPDAKPRGDRTDAHPTRKKDRALRRENESADTLAEHGYDVEQNPPGKPNGKNPDYKIEGEYFDCYAPESRNLDQIRKGISDKVADGQADRIVLNLDDCPRSQQEIEDILRRKPIEGLQEVKIVKDGQVIPFYPFTS